MTPGDDGRAVGTYGLLTRHGLRVQTFGGPRGAVEEARETADRRAPSMATHEIQEIDT